MAPMLVLVTDFGIESPYVGQMKAVLYRHCPDVPVVDLFHNIPAYSNESGAYLLPAYARDFPMGSVFLCVVDPGVGSERAAVALLADGNWYVGPDNGLFALVAARAMNAKWFEIIWRPEELSSSFHGRDLFAPVAAMLAKGDQQAIREIAAETVTRVRWPEELDEVIYVDHYGNLITGRRAATLSEDSRIRLGERTLEMARTFSSVSPGEAFWYANANGLLEIAVNRGDAAKVLQAGIGTPFEILV